MNSEQIHEALNYLDDDLILSVERLRTGNRPGRKHWHSIAACLCLLVAGAFAVRELGLFSTTPTPPDNGITPTNATQANPTDAPTTPTGAGITDGSQGTSQVDETTFPLTPTGTPVEQPSIWITISAWEDSGFLGEVSGLVDTDSIPVGTAVAVQFTENIGVDILEGNVICWIPGAPDADDFPVGSTVCVRFCRSDTHSDSSVTLYAEAVSSVCTTIKDG